MREARRAGAIVLVGLAIALIGRGRLPLWIVVAGALAAAYEFRVMAMHLNAARLDLESLDRHPLRAWTRAVNVARRRGAVERWLLLYATGDKALPAPFAAVPCVSEWPVPAPALLVDFAGVPKRGRLLTVFDAATGRVLGMGPVAGTRKTVALMRQD